MEGKPMKKIFIAVGVLMAAFIIMMAVAVFIVGPMIKTAVNTHGPKMTGTEVRLGDVKMSLFSAKATLVDFLLGNPPGFSAPQAVAAEKIQVNIDKKSLLTNRIVIEKIELISPHLYYEIQGKADNFRGLMTSMRKAAKGAETPSGQKSSKPAAWKSPDKNMLIRECLIKDGRVDLVSNLIKGKTITVALPDLHLTDIGRKEGGATPDEVFKILLYEVYGEIQSAQVSEAMNEQLQAFGTSLEQLKVDARKPIDDTHKGGRKGIDGVRESFNREMKKILGN
jgi:uncharacterized protein involved in outer membrane biogenesis